MASALEGGAIPSQWDTLRARSVLVLEDVTM